MTTIKTIEQTIYVRVSDSEDTLTLTQTTGGLELAANIVAGLNAADGPSAENAFATKTDIAAALSEVDANLHAHDEDVGAHAAAIGLHSASPDPHGDRAWTSNEVQARIEEHDTHEGAHAEISSRFDAAGAASTAVAAHAIADDPHGDRAYADDQLLGHAMDHLAHGALVDTDIPATITRDTELQSSMLAEVNARTAAIAGHNQDATAHGLSAEIIAGLVNSQNFPSDSNPFTTQADVVQRIAYDIATHSSAADPHGDRAFAASVGYPLPVPVNGDWSDAPTAYADIASRLRNLTVPEGQAFAIVLLSGNTLAGGANDSAVLLLKRNSGVLYVNYYKEFYAPPTAPGAPDVSVVAVLPFEPVSAADLLAHDEERPAHFLTTEIVEALNGSESPYDFPSPTNWVVTEAEMQEHRTANDPHGDRAFTASALNEHESLTFDPHGDRAYTTSSIATHASAPDPHGDRAYADAQIATHNSSAAAHGAIRSGVVAPLQAALFPSMVWNNQGTSVGYTYADHVAIAPQITGGTSTYGMRCFEVALPNGAGDFTVIGATRSISSVVGTHSAGFYIRNNSVVYNAMTSGYTALRCETRGSVSQTNSPTAIAQITTVSPVQPVWFKIERVGSTVTFYVSMDGQTWASYGSVSVGTATFTHCGFFAEQRVTSGWSVAEADSFSIA